MNAESRWLLRWLGYVLAAAVAALGVFGIAFGLQAEKLGNGLQLLGLFIAALGVPILSPALRSVELRAAAAYAATAHWIATKREAIRVRLARLRGGVTFARSGTVRSSAGVRGHATGARVQPVYDDMSPRELALRALDEIEWLRQEVRALDERRAQDRTDVFAALAALRTELQEHVLSVTREGWRYIVSGASVTAVGIIVALFG